MSRGGKTKEQVLSEKIDTYKNEKDTEKLVKARISDLNESIKSDMQSLGIDSFNSEKWVATVTTTKKESINEKKAIEILEDTLPYELFHEVVKTKQYIDDDVLEKLVYSGKFDISKLETCKTYGKEISTLRISKRKDK